VARHIDELATNVEKNSLKWEVANFEYYSLMLDESTDDNINKYDITLSKYHEYKIKLIPSIEKRICNFVK
jgi:hypothetical protein